MNATIEQVRPGVAGALPLLAWTDERLLLEYQAKRDERVFEELVKRYETELHSYLWHYMNDAEMADDVFQQTFLQVHLKCDQFEPGRKVRPWLYTIATNQAIDAQRRGRRHRMASLDRMGFATGDDSSDLQGRTEASPSEGAEAAEQSRCLRSVIDDLPEQSKQVVMLVYFQGLKYREAADILLIPVGTVKSRIHIAMQKLTERLSAAESHSG